MREKYETQKNENLNSIILIKSGNFYATIEDDAFIMKTIFNYQILKGKIGFPISSIDKVKSKLEELKVNYVVYNDNDNIIKKEFDNNSYLTILNNCKKQEYKDNMKKLLFDRIEYLINLDYDNYDKIRKFIDEL